MDYPLNENNPTVRKKLKDSLAIFAGYKNIHLRFPSNFLKTPATELKVLLILFFIHVMTGLAQHDTQKSNSDWNSGVLTLKDRHKDGGIY